MIEHVQDLYLYYFPSGSARDFGDHVGYWLDHLPEVNQSFGMPGWNEPMIDWRPIETIPTISLYDFSQSLANVLLFVPPRDGTPLSYAVGYAYFDRFGEKVVQGLQCSTDYSKAITHWAPLKPPGKKCSSKTTKKTSSTKFRSVKGKKKLGRDLLWEPLKKVAKKKLRKSRRKVDAERG